MTQIGVSMFGDNLYHSDKYIRMMVKGGEARRQDL